jgi:hypothetical protein
VQATHAIDRPAPADRQICHVETFRQVVRVLAEHVGAALLPEYFSRAWDLLRPGGVFLNHGVAYSATYRKRGPSFSDRYVFPDGELVPISTTLRASELSGFEVRDVESLREHYALTLRHWVRRLEAHADRVRSVTDDATYRTWRLYMVGAAHGFRSGRLNVHQALLAKTADQYIESALARLPAAPSRCAVQILFLLGSSLGCEPVPVYREPPLSPVSDEARQYPFVLITGSRFMPMYHSERSHPILSLRCSSRCRMRGVPRKSPDLRCG